MTPPEEVLSTLDDLVRAGKIRYVGVSNFSGWHLMKALGVADKYGYPRYVANQTYYSLIGREYEWELMPLGLEEGIGAVVWSPLGWGRLTGKIRRGTRIPKDSRLHESAEDGPQVEDEYLFKVVDALDAVAKETGKTVPQIALNWLLQRPTVSTVVIGARNEEQLEAEPRRGRLEPDEGADGEARCRERAAAGLSVLAPARLHRAQPAAGVRAPANRPSPKLSLGLPAAFIAPRRMYAATIPVSDRQFIELPEALVDHGFGKETAQETDLARLFSSRIAPSRHSLSGGFHNRLCDDVGGIASFDQFSH